ncbi:MAG: patatin-like phospholipase family protein [Lachnospiraceae bacterium]|nr:patatin-like phospholipase family protein [Lachnospiraceae bacterium]
MEKIGLVLAGGGAKGAYEIGVWKFLKECGLEEHICCVSGTSVGALNAALFAGSDYETAERIWLNIRKDIVLSPRKISTTDILKWLAMSNITIKNPFARLISKFIYLASSGALFNAKKMATLVVQKMHSDYFFSRSGMISLINEGVDFNKLKSGLVPCYATCLKVPDMKVTRFRINDYEKNDILTMLLASSALPIIFPNESYQGSLYCDGGVPEVGDNIPVRPVYDMGIRTIIVVYLGKEDRIVKEEFPGAHIIEIEPSEELGDLVNGTLDFSASGSKRRLNAGYKDAKEVIGKWLANS